MFNFFYSLTKKTMNNRFSRLFTPPNPQRINALGFFSTTSIFNFNYSFCFICLFIYLLFQKRIRIIINYITLKIFFFFWLEFLAVYFGSLSVRGSYHNTIEKLSSKNIHFFFQRI